MSLRMPRFLFREYEIIKRVKKGYNFLEIGPGKLELAEDLVHKFQKGTGIDFNKKVKDHYKQLSADKKKKLEVLVGDFFKYKFPEKFDCVIACEVMEHIEDDMGFLKHIHKLLNKNGQIILSVPSREKFWNYHDEFAGHVRRYEKNDVLKKMKKAGFKKVEVVSYGYPFINLLRLPRLIWAKVEKDKREKLTLQERTIESGMDEGGKLDFIFKLLVNRYTLLPLTLFSSTFNKADLSEGYVITGQK